MTCFEGYECGSFSAIKNTRVIGRVLRTVIVSQRFNETREIIILASQEYANDQPCARTFNHSEYHKSAEGCAQSPNMILGDVCWAC